MARKHVVQYFLQQQYLYTEMLDNLKDFKELYGQNKISEEEYLQMVKEIELVTANYERLAYVMVLLNKPNRDKKENKNEALNWYNMLEGASKEAVLDESKNVLADLKTLLEKGKESK